MITTIEYLEGWTLINKMVKVQIQTNENKIRAMYNKELIKEMDALTLVEEFIETLEIPES